MKYIYTFILLLNFLDFSYGQIKKDYGEKFEFDSKNETDPHFIFKDNYNRYLLTTENTYSIAAGHQMIVRKFDQKNNLVETFKYGFPKIDDGTMFKYLGFAEGQNGKAAVFVEIHSGREKKSEIYKLEFDKASAKFTSTMLATSPIISLSRSGDVDLEKSENEKYIAINFHKYREKGIADKNQLIVIDANTLNIAWQKEVSFENEFTSQNFTVTNSGKVVLVRDMKGSKKGITYLAVVWADGQEDKNFESQIFLNEMKAVSIGTEDYLIALNSNSKNFRSDYYNNLLLYDLKLGKILNNTKIPEFASVNNLEEVSIRNIMLQNNEMHIFTEAKAAVPMKTTNGYVSPASLETKYRFGPAYLFVVSFEGQLKTTKKLYVDGNAEADLYHSFGFVNIKGTYYINTGNFTGVYPLNNANNFEKGESKINFYQGDPYGNMSNKFINQLITYFPDSNSLLLGRVVNVNEMSLVNVFGIN